MNPSRRIYLDHAATTPLDPATLDVMLPFLRDDYGNPSSAHGIGQRARRAIDEARDRVAEAIAARPREIVFTSGGTEADNLALRGVLDRHAERGRHVVTSAIEHHAVLDTAEALAHQGRAEVAVVGCDGAGRVDPEEIAAAVRDDTVLVSVMHVNNEVGTVQPLAEIVEAVRRRNPGVLIHSDGVQALGKVPVDIGELGVDLYTLSSHKVYGPKGAGALFVRHGVLLGAQVSGGGQERARRSGTENVAAIAGFGHAAVRAAAEREAEMARQRTLARRLGDALVEAIPDIVLTGSAMHRVGSIASFAIPGVPSEVLVTALDAEGVCASGGSACSSGATEPSHVLAAMGLTHNVAQGSLRLSLGRQTTADDVDAAARIIVTAVIQARAALAG